MSRKRFFASFTIVLAIGLILGHLARADEKKPAASKEQKPTASSDQTAADRKAALDKAAAGASQINVGEGTTAGAIRGATAAQPPATTKPLTLPELARIGVRGTLSADDENAKNDSDPKFTPQKISADAGASPASLAALAHVDPGPGRMRLKDVPNAKEIVTQAATLAGANEIKVALLGQHKYMITDCLGVKVSVGEFRLKLAKPTVTLADEGVIVEFKIDQVKCDAFSLRFRPDPFDAVHPCHFSARAGLGGEANDVSIKLTYNPVVDVEKCMIGSPGAVAMKFAAGHVELNPLPPGISQLNDPFKDMIVDALNYTLSLETGIGGQTGMSTSGAGPMLAVMMDKMINQVIEANCPFKNSGAAGQVADATKSVSSGATNAAATNPASPKLPTPIGSPSSGAASAQPMFTISPNPELKGQLGRLVLKFPTVAKATRVRLYRPGEPKEIKQFFGDGEQSLVPGTYDVAISGRRITGVVVQTASDTSLHVGVLKTTADKKTKYIVRDADDKTELISGYGSALIGLPIGQYHLVVNDVSTPITIEQDKTLEY
jgi:hypothetical protein